MKSLLLLCVSVMDAQGGNHLSPHRLGGTLRKKIGGSTLRKKQFKERVSAKILFLARIGWGAPIARKLVGGQTPRKERLRKNQA